jgi:4-amino-4-deoxy-L-arabinose transferase-like glycosyltransferase
LILVLGLLLVPMSIHPTRPAVFDVDEADRVSTSAQTAARSSDLAGDGWTLDRLQPVRDGVPRFIEPPGATWLHVLVGGWGAGSGPSAAPQDSASGTRGAGAGLPGAGVVWMRGVSVAGALLAVAGVFWIGLSVGGSRTAIYSAVVFATCLPVLWYGRLATADMPALGAGVLSIAGALWAVRPLRPVPKLARQAVGWLVCGLGLGGAVLIGGPGAVVEVLLPLGVIVLLVPNRGYHLLGLLAAGCLAGLTLLPWALHVHGQDPEMYRKWSLGLMPTLPADFVSYLQAAGWRVGLLLAGLGVWSAWLAAAAIQPLSTSSVGSRQRMFIGWSWFAAAAGLAVLLPGPGDLRGLLFVLPAAALLLGQLFRRYADLSGEGRHARTWRWTRWVMIGLTVVLSLALPAAGYLQPQWSEWLVQGVLPKLLHEPMLAERHWVYWAGAGVALLGLAVLGGRWSVKAMPGAAMLVWGLWVWAAAVVLAGPLTDGPYMQRQAAVVLPAAQAGVEQSRGGSGKLEGWLEAGRDM